MLPLPFLATPAPAGIETGRLFLLLNVGRKRRKGGSGRAVPSSSRLGRPGGSAAAQASTGAIAPMQEQPAEQQQQQPAPRQQAMQQAPQAQGQHAAAQQPARPSKASVGEGDAVEVMWQVDEELVPYVGMVLEVLPGVRQRCLNLCCVAAVAIRCGGLASMRQLSEALLRIRPVWISCRRCLISLHTCINLQGKHRIEYLDGEVATQDLDEEQWRLLLQVGLLARGNGWWASCSGCRGTACSAHEEC